MTKQIKLTADDIVVIDKGDENYSLRFCSLEGYEVLLTLSEAEQLKQQILENQKIVDIVKLWAEKEPITTINSITLTPKEIRIRGGSVHHLANLIKKATGMDIKEIIIE